MGRKLDLSGLTDNEAEHVLQVVQRDMRLRKKEEERLSDLKQELDEEGSRCLLLSRQSCFNQRCCIRCCSPFNFLLNPKRPCLDCHFNVCKACRVYSKRDKTWLCSACQKSRLLKTQSLEWFYTNVKTRFKRFGSAKVLKTLYRKHLVEHSALSEFTEGSGYEESICNEGSISGSDSAFYRQIEEHSMAETLTVALRVAEEAIDEAISKAEFDTASQEKQNEALYLREHRGQLVEELSKTIVQKIISRRNTLAEMRAEYDQVWPIENNTDHLHHHHHPHHPDCDQASSSIEHQPGLWRSHSAFSLLDNNPAGRIQSTQTLKKKEGGTLPTWKSVDRLDNAAVSSVSRPGLLTKRKSPFFSALEREAEVVSAYEGVSSDNETKADSSWGGVLQEIHRKMADSNFNLQDGIPFQLPGSRDELFSDSEGERKPRSLLALFKRKVPTEIRKPASSRGTSIIDVNFNVEGNGEEEEREVAAEPEVLKVRRSRKKRRSKKKLSSSVRSQEDIEEDDHYQQTYEAATPDTLTSGASTPESDDLESDITGSGANQTEQELTSQPQFSQSSSGEEEGEEAEDGGARDASDDEHRKEERQESQDGYEEDEGLWRMEIDPEEGRTEEGDDEEMESRLYRLVAHSRRTYFSSTDDDLDKVGQSDAECDEDKDEDVEEEKVGRLNSKLCELEKEVRANQFSSTEDELDRAGVMDEEEEKKEEEEELTVKVCRLVNQANATLFSSTEDELDRVGRGEEAEEAMAEETLWKMQQEHLDVQNTRLRDLASLVSASQFSSSEDELERVGETEEEANEEGIEREEIVGDLRESFEDLDVDMFDVMGEHEERKTESSDEDVCMQERVPAEDICDEKVDILEEEAVKKAQGTERRQEMEFETVIQAEKTEEVILNKAKVQQVDEKVAKLQDKEEVEEKQEEGQDAETDSDVDDAEFERIISSMLMMTLEDMQVGTLEEEATENRSENIETEDTDESATVGGFEDSAVDARSTKVSEETGKVSQSRGDVKGNEQIGGDISRKKENENATGGNENEGEDTDVQEGHVNAAMEETPEVKQTCERIEVGDEEQDGRRGAVLEEGTTMETQGDREVKETDERREETKESVEDMEQSSTSTPHGLLSPEEIQNRYSAVSLRSITTEVLKVLNATEELLLQGGGGDGPPPCTPLPPHTDPKKLDQQFSRLEENVYVAAGEVFSLEAELGDLEEVARGVCSDTPGLELSFLEEQVASAAARVQQSELQISDISARIAALKSAGLNVDTQQARFTKTRTVPFMPVTVDSSRQQRRRLPAPPVKEEN
ncbi:rab effector MyRIP [Gymnodraco acuticeps]|uniref:Rab effector MyRIP n=1 Tax=Gymnodraco acuticeps TaxID=8218 RepID=A0A6P8TK00_GYMAC|nr:rab effector MyRIP [Gymnodraco acuticeps]XP_034064372.1 rab effector MyRIP [Gymnodraco acuticeps]